MITNIADITSDRELKEWLTRFFALTDLEQRTKGFALYNQQAVSDFQDKIFGFTATVNDSNKHSISVFFEGVNKAGLPHLDKALFTCSCSNDAMMCDHIIAVVIKWAVDMDWKRQIAKKLAPMSQRRSTASPTLKKLGELAQKNPPVSFSKNNRLDWVFHPYIDEVMRTIQKAIKREMK